MGANVSTTVQSIVQSCASSVSSKVISQTLNTTTTKQSTTASVTINNMGIWNCPLDITQTMSASLSAQVQYMTQNSAKSVTRNYN